MWYDFPMKRESTTKKKKVSIIVQKESEPAVIEIVDDSIDFSMDPRKALFLRMYFDRESPTWGNAKQSAIHAGFSHEYADVITYQKPKWFADFVSNQDFVQLAESHLREVLQLPNVAQAMGAFGPISRKIPTGKYEYKKVKGKKKKVQIFLEEPVIVPNTSVIKVKNEAAKLVLPAYNPAYAKSAGGPKVSFNFNVKAARERYNGENKQ